MEKMIALSNVMSNAHFFAINFAMSVWKLSGEVLNIPDEYGAMLCCVSMMKFENLGIEFNRENVLSDIEETAEGYVKIPQMRHAFDELYKATILGDDYVPAPDNIS